MKGRGSTFGAVSIVNAVAGGKGVTASIRLGTEAVVELVAGPGEWKIIANGKAVESKLATETVSLALKMAGKDASQYSATVETTTALPMGVGLKTSSSASSAIALAVFAALGQRAFDPQRIMTCSVDASLASGASVTGAMDDSAACLLGGINLVDNLGRKVERSKLFDKPLKVIIKVPKAQSRRAAVEVAQVRKLGRVAEVLYRMSMEGDLWRAMTLNGTLYSAIYGYDGRAALQAVEHGALGASLSGTGPATAAVFEPKMSEEVKKLAEAWQADGSVVMETETNNEHGRIESLD
ncbi:MAG: shikimate kinase [Nitrososphaerota archaeon]|nr:shikimate kinase [Nitrososphaerota archaeon]